jgi:hypothetical protein
MQPIGVFHQALPCVLEQVFGDIAASGQAREECEETAVELRVNEVERFGVAGAKTRDALELMRPLSLAGIFAGVCSLLVGLANGLQALANLQTFDAQTVRVVFVVLAEAVIPTFLAFACLTVAWLCVAMGMRKLS